MIELVTVMPDAGVDHKRGQKHPFVVNELFGCECQALIDMFFQHEVLMETLFRFLDLDQSASILDGYFAKVAGLLLNRNATNTLEFLSSKGKLSRLPKRLHSRSISEFVVKLLVAEVNLQDQGVKKDLVSEVISLLGNTSEIVVSYASGVLTELISKLGEGSHVKELISSMASGENLKKLMDSAQSDLIHSVAHSIEVVKQLVLSPIREELFKASKASDEDETVIADEEPSEFSKALTQTFPALSQRLQRESAVLKNTQKKEAETLGTDRLKISELFLTCLRLDRKEISSALRDHQVFEKLTQLFFSFEMNSFLHNLYESFVSILFDQLANDGDVLRDLVVKSELLQRLVPSCENKGYAGQVVKIGTTLLKVKARNSEFSKFLEDSSEWKDFYFEFYAKKTELEKKTLGETNSKISDDLSSDDSGHMNEPKDTVEMLLSNFDNNKKTDEDDDFDREEPEGNLEPMDIDDLKQDKPDEEGEKVFGSHKVKKSSKRYKKDDELDYGAKQVQEEVLNEDYWRF